MKKAEKLQPTVLSPLQPSVQPADSEELTLEQLRRWMAVEFSYLRDRIRSVEGDYDKILERLEDISGEIGSTAQPSDVNEAVQPIVDRLSDIERTLDSVREAVKNAD